MSIKSTVFSQFKRPHGALGALAGWVIANRPSNKARNHWTIELLDIQPTDRVLEIGFGPGFAIVDAASRACSGLIVGIDHSEIMVRKAGKRNREGIRSGRVQLRLGGLEILPSLCGPFDKVLSANVVQFWPDSTWAFRQIYSSNHCQDALRQRPSVDGHREDV
jgi:SAM-dependent methyltransferase